MTLLYLPRGHIRAPIERSLASQLAPHEFRACIAPEEFEPRIWRDICRIYARHWLENLDNWPVASLFAYQLACSPLVSSRLSPTRTSTQPRTLEVLTSSTASQQC